jgi:mono/diheme cytochrome c family protein
MRTLLLAFFVIVCLPLSATHLKAGRAPEVSYERSAPQLYRRYCVSCHGNDGKAKTSKGKFNHARDLSDTQWQDEVSDARIFNSIMNGRNERGNMPPFSGKLNEKQINSLVDYVRKLKGPTQ